MIKVKVEGLRELDAALGELTKATARGVLRRVLMRAGEPIERMAAALAPELTGALQRSIDTGTKLTRRQRKLHEKKSFQEVFVGAGGLPQAITQEFGTVDHGPQPFLRPAWDAHKMTALKIIRDDLGEEIRKTAERAAKRAARLAAKAQAQG